MSCYDQNELRQQLADLEDRAAAREIALEQRCKRLEHELQATQNRMRMLQQVYSQASVCQWELAVTSARFSIRGALSNDPQHRLLEPLTDFSDLLSAIPSEDRKAFNALYDRALISGESFEFEHPLELADGRRRIVRHICKPFLSAEGTPLRVMGLILDMSEVRDIEAKLRDARDEAERAAKVKSDFLANMSHEIRTPMNAILGMCQLVMATQLDERQHDYLAKMQTSARSLLGIINEILDLSKIEAGSISIESVALSIDGLLDDVSAVLASGIRDQGIAFMVHRDEAIGGNYLGDPPRIGQVLRNLVGNAQKFTEQGVIAVNVSRVSHVDGADQIRFDVSDTGIGMSASQIQRLFQPFVQGDSTTTRRFGGTGLGLTISRSLIEIMGGRIWVESTPGVGSTFSFVLPLVPTDELSSADVDDGAIDASASITGIERLGGARVLIVEDNAINQQIASEFLERVGILVDIAENGQEALERLRAGSYDCVLMDIQMPIMDGYQATRLIREEPAWNNLPVIAMTANVLGQHRQMAKDVGMNGFVGKPISNQVLYQELLRCMRDFAGEGDAVAPGVDADVSPIELPDQLPGMDMKKALQGVGGNRHLLHTLLFDFLRDHGNDATVLADAIDRDDLVKAGRLAHTLKSLCAALGADALAGHCRAIEAACEARGDVEAAELAAFNRLFGELIAGLQEWVALQPCHPDAAAPDQAQLRATADALAEAIDEMSPEVVSLATQLLRAMPDSALAAQLLAECECFEFDDAATTLARMDI